MAYLKVDLSVGDGFENLCAGFSRTSRIGSHSEFTEAFEVGDELGRGTGGVVNAVQEKPGSSRLPSFGACACKTMSKVQAKSRSSMALRRMRDE